MRKDVFTWTYIVLAVVCLIAGGFMSAMTLAETPDAVAVGVVGAVIYLIVFFAIMRFLPIWRKGSLIWVLVSLYWGAFMVISTVMITELAFSDILKEAGLGRFEASATGAIPEELAKALGVFVILFMARRVWDRPWHGLLAGLSVGMGFEIMENFVYSGGGALYNATSDVQGATEMWILRTGLGFGLHPMCAGLAGFGIASALMLTNKSMVWRLMVGIGSVLGAIAFHGWWNFQWPSSLQLVAVIVDWLALLAVTIVILVKNWSKAKRDKKRPLPSHKEAWDLIPVRDTQYPSVPTTAAQ